MHAWEASTVTFLDNLRIGSKIAVSSGVTLLLLLIAIVIALLGLVGASENFAAYRELARGTNAFSAVRAELMAARIGVKDFILSGDEGAADTAQHHIAAAQSQADAAGALVAEPEIKAELQATTDGMAAYAETFAALLPLHDSRLQLVARMDAAGEEAATVIGTLLDEQAALSNMRAVTNASSVQRHLLLARLSAARFLVDNLPAQAERVAAEFAELDGKVEILRVAIYDDVGQQQIDSFTAQAATFRTAFEEVVQIVGARNAIVAERLDPAGRSLAGNLETFSASAISAQDALGPQAQASIVESEIVSLAAAAIALILAILLSVLVGRGIARPISSMTAAMQRLAEGDKSVEIHGQGRRDEVGEMAAAVQVFKDNMIRNDEMAAEQERAQAAREERARQIEALTGEFDRAVAAVLAGVGTATAEMQGTATSMSATAEETNRQAAAVAAAAEEASSNVQTVAAAAEELSSSIEEIGRQVSQSSMIASRASEDAQRTNERVDGLKQSAQKIGEVVSLIQDIAEQTNLLALNATIEAARAGEAGKGFAVVASEVKNLATQTARATEQIGQQISGIQGETNEAVAAIQGIVGTIAEVNEIATTIASAVEEQGAATQEISRNVQEAAQGTQDVSANIGGVTDAAAGTGAAAEQVKSSAAKLAAQSESLRQAVESFLQRVRAA